MWLMLIIACAKNTENENEPAQFVPVTQDTYAETSPEPVAEPVVEGNIVLDGINLFPDWDDGDTFSYTDSETGEDVSARLTGYNTLESYGPVHRWGDWSAEELYGLSQEAGRVAREGNWSCTTLPGSCGYGRICVSCPGLQEFLLENGLAHIFSLRDDADPTLLAIQHESQQAGRGMWEKGVPNELVTSLHSLDERENQTQTYNRLISTETGRSIQLHHSENYESCDWICPTDSCLLYVPYQERYGDSRAECLQSGAESQ